MNVDGVKENDLKEQEIVKENEQETVREDEQKRAKKKISVKYILLVLLLVIFAAVALGTYIYLSNKSHSSLSSNVSNAVQDAIIGEEGEVTTITKSSIEEVLNISELQTADYIYNAIVDVYDEDGTTLKYHVAYEGTITAGINFDEVEIEVLEDEKEIVLTMPEVSIQDTIVNSGTLEYIFTKDKYDNEKDNVYKEAYSKCQEDLEEKANSDTRLLETAQNNAKQVVEALMTPWIEQTDSVYTVTIQ